MNELLRAPADPKINMEAIVANLAQEGVPVRAIARSTKIPSEDVREILDLAMDAGTILQIPRDDWTIGSTKDNRDIGIDAFAALNEAQMKLYCVKLFNVTALQGAVLSALIRRKELTREAAHVLINAQRTAFIDETTVKMVDVVVCHLRKRLRKLGPAPAMVIKTIWGQGYYMVPDDRIRCRDIIAAHLKSEGVGLA